MGGDQIRRLAFGRVLRGGDAQARERAGLVVGDGLAAPSGARVGEAAGAELSDVVFGDPVRVGEVNVAGDQLVGVAVQLDDRPPVRAVAVGGHRAVVRCWR